MFKSMYPLINTQPKLLQLAWKQVNGAWIVQTIISQQLIQTFSTSNLIILLAKQTFWTK